MSRIKVLSVFLQLSAVRSRELLSPLANIFYNQMFQATCDEIFSNNNGICQASDTQCLQLCLPSVVQVHLKSHIIAVVIHAAFLCCDLPSGILYS